MRAPIVSVVCALLLALCAAAAATECTVVAAPCDGTWRSSQNQTFAFLGVGQPNFVQLYSYFGAASGCLSRVQDATSGNTSLPLANAICALPASVFQYGPGSIKSYVAYYFHPDGNVSAPAQCLTLNTTGATESSAQLPLSMQPCCTQFNAQGEKTAASLAPPPCTSAQQAAQMWLEPPTSLNPYARINSQFTVNSAAFCLTRIGDSC